MARHSFLVRVAGAHAVVVAVAGWAVDGLAHGLLEASPVAVLALAGQRMEGPRGRWPVSLALLVSSAMLVHQTGGLIEMHFHFFVVVSLIALYRNWATLLTTAAFVALHHGILGSVAPQEVYNHPAAIAHPWLWAAVHALLILLAVAVCSMWWRYSELAEAHAGALAREQELGAMRELQTAALRRELEREQSTIERLHELEELRATFLRAVSHELRTPLTSIVGYAATLERHDGRLDDDQRGHLAGRLRVNADRLSRLLTDLLDLGRLTAGQEVLDRSEADLASAVARVITEVEASGHVIEVDIADDVRIAVDVGKFERIVDNLLRNAVRHTPAGTRIQLRLVRDDVSALLSVSDDGPGIPVDLRDRLFRPFEQGPASRYAASPGTGIGLSLVRSFAELHGGRAWVEDSPTGGACFKVRLPDAPASSTITDERSPREPALTPHRQRWTFQPGPPTRPRAFS